LHPCSVSPKLYYLIPLSGAHILSNGIITATSVWIRFVCDGTWLIMDITIALSVFVSFSSLPNRITLSTGADFYYHANNRHSFRYDETKIYICIKFSANSNIHICRRRHIRVATKSTCKLQIFLTQNINQLCYRHQQLSVIKILYNILLEGKSAWNRVVISRKQGKTNVTAVGKELTRHAEKQILEYGGGGGGGGGGLAVV
jgi:hypothetical protein